jgi:hypothetical protein
MKTILLFTFLSFISLQINAQCIENASNFGNNTSVPGYNVSGDISVTLNANNTVTLQLGDNFRTAAGPDVRAYLVNSEGRSINQLKALNPNNLNNIAFGLISCSGCSPVIPANGAQTLTVAIPDGKDITDYDTVFFYCLAFNAFWDVGSYSSFSTSNCTILNVDTFTADEIVFYPNPAKNQIQLSNIEGISAEIRIFNVLGKQVFYQSKIKEKTIDVSSLNKGIYLVKINVDKKSKTQKLIIQ